MDVSQTYNKPVSMDDTTNMTYNISVNNTGETKLNNVTLNDTLPPGMEFRDARYSGGEKTDLLLLSRAKRNGDWRVNVILSLGELETSESKLIILNASHDGPKKDPESYYANNSICVFGEAPDKLEVNASNTTASYITANDTAKPPNNTTTNTTANDTNESLNNGTENGTDESPDNPSVIDGPGPLNDTIANDSVRSPAIQPET